MRFQSKYFDGVLDEIVKSIAEEIVGQIENHFTESKVEDLSSRSDDYSLSKMASK